MKIIVVQSENRFIVVVRSVVGVTLLEFWGYDKKRFYTHWNYVFNLADRLQHDKTNGKPVRSGL